VGTLRARFRGLSSPHAAAVSVRTSFAGGGVAYGGTEPNPASRQIVDWLKEDTNDRSNLAIVNAGGPDDGDIRVRATLFSTDPAAPGNLTLPDVILSPGAFRQFNRVLTTSGLNASSGFARIARTDGSAPFLAWGVLNDQVTSDGSIVFARTDQVGQDRRFPTLTTVIETAAYETEVIVTNAGPTSVSAGLYYSAADVAPDGSATLAVTIPSGSAWYSASFVDELRRRGVFGIGPRGSAIVGMLSTNASSSYSFETLGLGARVLTSSPTGGRYGVFLSSMPFAAGFPPQSSAWIPDLRQDASLRTNLVLVGGVFRVELFDPGGGLVAIREDVPSGQINSVLKVWAPGTSRAWARVTRTSTSENPFAAYAVINDGAAPGLGTGDGSIVWMETEQ
jgi:hypothetical protein